jgi:hypothetical protein
MSILGGHAFINVDTWIPSMMGLPLVVYGPMVLGNPWYFPMGLYVMNHI